MNCKLHNVWGRNSDKAWHNNCIEIRGGSNSNYLIQNNYLQIQRVDGDSSGAIEFGVNESNGVIIRNNVSISKDYFAHVPFGALVDGNVWFGDGDREFRIHGGGIASANNTYYTGRWEDGRIPEAGKLPIRVAELYVDHDVYKLSENSVLLNSGSDNALFNDRDGTRNDAGASGGVWYDPNGWTTDKPVVLSFDISKDAVLEGIDTEVILSEGQAVSAPPASE